MPQTPKGRPKARAASLGSPFSSSSSSSSSPPLLTFSVALCLFSPPLGLASVRFLSPAILSPNASLLLLLI